MKVLEEAKKLISLPSVTGGEGAIARYLASRFERMGCRVELYPAAPGRPNVYARAEGADSRRPALLFHGHLDTVAPFGMAEPFVPRIREGRLYGRGAVDQKGGLAAAVCAFEEALSQGKPVRSFAFAGVIDEEAEHRGSMALRRMGVDADFGIVTEPSGLRLGIGCKGTAPVLLEVRGRAAHGCRPWLGKNAILAGMEAASLILDEPLPVCTLEGIGDVCASINLGKMEGGDAYNIVPDTCRIWFDRRLIPGENQREVLSGINHILSRIPGKEGIAYRGVIARPDWNWKPIQERGLLPAMAEIDSTQVALLKEIHREREGEDPEIFFTDGYNEMDFLINDLGINAVQYGPGDSSLCHTHEEHLDIFQLDRCVGVYRELIKRLCYPEGPPT